MFEGPDSMTRGDRREPLWATSLADQPRYASDAVRPDPGEKPPEAPPSAPDRLAGLRAVALGGLAAAIVVVVAMIAADGISFNVEEVPSYWEDIEMTCHTARVEREEDALEVFSCKAVDGGTLPAGVYRSPESLWTSDLTRRDARANEIEISPDGKLTGWAVYW